MVKAGHILDDDDFMHITCHMDNALAAKVAKGEFVDLEKLLVKDKMKRKSATEERLEFVNHNGQTYLTPLMK